MKMALTRCLITLGLITSAVNVTLANEETAADPDTNRVARLGEILVVGDRDARDLLANPSLESASLDIAVSTVDSEAIRLRNAATLTEALDLSTGVFTEQRGRKEKQLSSFRGQIYPYPDFALNGVWQRAFWEIPAFFPAVAIDRIEVLRSGGAILTGPNSGLVGAINIVPRRFDEPSTIFDVQGGRFNTFRSSVVHGDRFDKGDYTIGGSFYRTSGPSHENAAEHFTTLFGTGSWEPNDELRFEMTGFFLRGERELRRIKPPGANNLRNRLEEYSPITSYGLLLRTLVKHSEVSSTEFDIGYVGRDADFNNRVGNKPVAKNREEDREFNLGLIHAYKLSPDNTLRAGLQYNHWYCPNGKRHFVGNRMNVHTLSAVVTDEHEWDRLTLDGGLRLTRSWYRDYAERTFAITGENLSGRTISNEWGEPALTTTLGAKYRLDPPLSLYGHVAFGHVDVPAGAVSESGSKLDRENRLILDGGVMAEQAGYGTLKFGGFITYRNNALLLNDTKVSKDGELFNTYGNSDVRQYGLEMEGQTEKVADLFSLFFNATVMNSQSKNSGSWRRHREIPQAILAAGLNFNYKRLDVNLYGKHVSRFKNRRFSVDGQERPLGDYVDLSLTAGLTLGRERRTRIYASLDNLLDDHYSTVIGYPDYGFRCMIGLQHKM